jgi:hypothetical protein
MTEISCRRLTEEEFFAEVDAAIAEADAGMLEDSEIMEARIAEKIKQNNERSVSHE